MKFNCELKRVVDDSYDIEIGRKLQDTLVSDLKGGLVGKIKKFAVVTDSIVVDLYGRDIYDRLNAAGLKAELFVIPEGEKSKTRQMKEFVEDSMLEKGFRRWRRSCHRPGRLCCRNIWQRSAFCELCHNAPCGG